MRPIDIGANSVPLKVARIEGRRIKLIHEDRQVTHLGEQVFITGLFSPDAGIAACSFVAEEVQIACIHQELTIQKHVRNKMSVS